MPAMQAVPSIDAVDAAAQVAGAVVMKVGANSQSMAQSVLGEQTACRQGKTACREHEAKTTQASGSEFRFTRSEFPNFRPAGWMN